MSLKNEQLVEGCMFKRKFIITLVCCLPIVIMVLGVVFFQQRSMSSSSNEVSKTYNVVLKSKELETSLSEMVAAQRGYLVSGNNAFLASYEGLKSQSFASILELAPLIVEEKNSQDKVKFLNTMLLAFCDLLEQNISRFSDKTVATPYSLEDDIELNKIHNKMTKVLSSIIKRENELLGQHLTNSSLQERRYYFFLFGGLAVCLAVILVFFVLLVRSIEKQYLAEEDTKKMHKRFVLAMSSTTDGIFDWDFVSNERFFSPRLKEMLGYKEEEFKDTHEFFNQLIHPADYENFWIQTNNYLKGHLKDYSITYRLKCKNGKWLWVNSRARALYDQRGNAIRLIGVLTDITKIKENELQLKSDKLRAVKANKAKSIFLANMSHEIRTPLNSIIGISNILSQSHQLPEKNKNLVKILNFSSIHLLELINNVLDLSKIENNELSLKNEEFDPSGLFQQVISIMSVRAKEKSLDFNFSLNNIDKYKFVGDSLRLRQVLINLIGNAIKFTDEGHIKIDVRYKRKHLLIDIEDTGIGISKEKLETIFERFEQEDDSTSRKYTGTGLGLSISRELIRAMGGTINVRSTKNIGSTFEVDIPISAVKKKSLEIVPNLDKPVLSAERKLLIVEDYEPNVVVIEYIINSLGINFDVATSGADAISKYKENRYDMILMDINMPHMDGLEATSLIRNYEKENNLDPSIIIAMTAHVLSEDQEACQAAGMDDYIAKPIMEKDIIDKINYFFQRVA